MAKMNGSRYFAEFMKGYGVTHIFHVPAILMKPLAEMEDMNIRRVMVHGEKAAAYMADGYARASGKPGICMAQNAGASNLMAGLRDAYMACSPVIAFTGGPTADSRYRHSYQDIEDAAQFDVVTKFNVRLDNASRMPDLLRQAFREATSGSPGPVHLQVCGPIGDVTNVEGEFELVIEDRFRRVPAFRPEPDAQAVRDALAMLDRAKKPIIVAGGGVTASEAQKELVALAEKLGIPVATSLNAKGAILDSHWLAAGVVGLYSRSCANRAVSEADLVFFAGSHTGGQVTNGWKIPAPGTMVIQLDIDAAEIGRNYPAAVGLMGDAKVTLGRMVEAAKPASAAARAQWQERVKTLVAEWRKEAGPMLNSDAVPMRPERLCKEISEALPANGVLVADTGHAGMWTGEMIEFKQAGQRYLRCAGSLGWSFPASLGAKCALPDRPVVCFTGDGGFYYHLAELETAARYGINAVVVVNDNHALNQEIGLINGAYGGTQRGKADEMWRFQNIDLAKVAESLGCVGMRAEKPAEFRAALEKAFTMNRPVVIDAISDVKAMAKRGWSPGGGGGH
jgi:acetolactate synthase-1/2/3 large subunit